MRKYWLVYKISWQKQLEYRFNFFLGRLRSVIVLLLLYFVWLNLTRSTGRFASYSGPELFTYVFGVNLLRSVVFGAQSRETAMEINDGTFSLYLLKPVRHIAFVFSRELAERTLYFVSATAEILLFAALLDVEFRRQADARLLCLSLASCSFSLVLYFLLSYIVSLAAFWSREALGPRFLFEWFLEFASGAYFPLDILSRGLFLFLSALPFFCLVYLPVTIYMGRYTPAEAALGILAQALWIAALGLLARRVWRKGLRRFTGEGI